MNEAPRPSALDLALEAISREAGVRFEDRVGTPAEHERFWSAYDWSKGGTEWGSAAFVGAHLAPFLATALRPGIRVLEIGVGAGRATELLVGEGREVILADISGRCLEQTAARFPGERLRSLLVEEGRIDRGIEPGSVDLAVSWDTFVHLDHATTASYLSQLGSLLRVGAYGIVHHADTRKAGGWRGDVNLVSFVEMLVENDFVPLAHTRFVDERVNLLGHFDYLTFFARGLRALFAERLDRARREGAPGVEVFSPRGNEPAAGEAGYRPPGAG